MSRLTIRSTSYGNEEEFRSKTIVELLTFMNENWKPRQTEFLASKERYRPPAPVPVTRSHKVVRLREPPVPPDGAPADD